MSLRGIIKKMGTNSIKVQFDVQVKTIVLPIQKNFEAGDQISVSYDKNGTSEQTTSAPIRKKAKTARQISEINDSLIVYATLYKDSSGGYLVWHIYFCSSCCHVCTFLIHTLLLLSRLTVQ